MLPFVENRRIFVEQGVRRWGWLLHNAENLRLKRENEILKKATAYFARDVL
jgi:transposase-like protein